MRLRIVILLIVAIECCFAAARAGEKPTLTVDGQRAKTYVAHLSSDVMEGRASGTAGYRRAADWVAAQFRQWGLQPAGEDGTYFQEVVIGEFNWRTGRPTLQVGQRDFPLDDGNFSVHPGSTPQTTVRGEIVFAGYGIAAAEKGLDEYEGINVRNKVVLLLLGSPDEAPPRRRMFERQDDSKDQPPKQSSDKPWQEEAKLSTKARVAYEKGAAAVLLYDPDAGADRGRRPGRSRPSAEPFSFQPGRGFLCFTIEEPVFRAVMKRDPQESPGGLKRRLDDIRRSIREKKPQSCTTGVVARMQGYDVAERHDEDHGNNVARNVLAKIPGTDPQRKDQYVLVGAHLDHVGVRKGYIYNGADDNASGAAVVMEVARVLAQGKVQPRRTLIFCCWCGEERGLLGSLHYTDQPCDGVTMDRVVAYFNIDMVGAGERLAAMGALNFPSIWDVIQRDQHPEILKRLKPSQGGPGGSDHTGFIRRGIEAIMLISQGGPGHPDYHQPEDDAQKIDPEMLRLTGQFVLEGMLNLASETETTLLIENRQQLYRAMRMRIVNYNPQLPDSRFSQVEIKPRSREALYDEICRQARALAQGTSAASSDQSPKSPQGDRPPKKSLSRGLADVRLIGDDLRLLELVVDFYGIGRLDLSGDDGAWVTDGRLTDVGKEALKTLENNNVLIRLVAPSRQLVDDVLRATTKPFVITGDYQVSHRQVSPLVDRGVLLGIDFDPQKVGDFLARVEAAKNQLGERRNLFAYLTSSKGLEEAKRPLYLGLIARGWAHQEICGGRKHGGLIGGAGLSDLGPEARRSP